MTLKGRNIYITSSPPQFWLLGSLFHHCWAFASAVPSAIYVSPKDLAIRYAWEFAGKVGHGAEAGKNWLTFHTNWGARRNWLIFHTDWGDKKRTDLPLKPYSSWHKGVVRGNNASTAKLQNIVLWRVVSLCKCFLFVEVWEHFELTASPK